MCIFKLYSKIILVNGYIFAIPNNGFDDVDARIKVCDRCNFPFFHLVFVVPPSFSYAPLISLPIYFFSSCKRCDFVLV